MESNDSQQVSTDPFLDYTFAFNAKFSDRTLQLQIMAMGSLPRKRKTKHSNGVQSNRNSSSANLETQVKTIHISTPILAAKSKFFFKLFSNGMSELDDQHVTLRIQESEAAFMDMLKFMYTNTLSSTTPSAILGVLIAADKYEVTSCMKYCLQSLPKSSMTCESALLYLDLPSTIEMDDTVRPLVDRAKEFLVAHFKDNLFREEMLNLLPLPCVEVVLSSDDLQVNSEDEIYDFVMKWAQKNYTNLPKRREILNSRLLPLVRFQYMSCKKLKEFQGCTDITLKRSSELVFNALSLQIPHRQLSLVSHKERAYTCWPVKLTRFNSPREECVVYLDLKREDCQLLYPSKGIKTQTFDFLGQQFYLLAKCCVKPSPVHSFGLFLHMQEKGSLGVGVAYKFSARRKPDEEFVSKFKGACDITEATGYGRHNLFGVPWDTFIAEDSPYFINGVLHLRAVIKLKK